MSLSDQCVGTSKTTALHMALSFLCIPNDLFASASICRGAVLGPQNFNIVHLIFYN